jgi:hypothetical protein
MKVRPIEHNNVLIGHAFFCVGCLESHAFYLDRWKWDGNEDSPTVVPSIKMVPPHQRCHLNITRGMLHYHGDCDHALARQVLPMESV